MWKAITENKVTSTLLAAYIGSMTGGVITATIINFVQDTAHHAEVKRSMGVDEAERDRTTLAIKLALEARDMAIQNGTAVGIHHNESH